MFVFGEPLNVTDDLHYNKQELIVSEKLMAYWTNFGKFRYGRVRSSFVVSMIDVSI